MINRLKIKSEFSRNALILMAGTSVAQGLPIAAAPILTRIYTPEEFGLFGFYFAIVSILSVIVAGRYELAIVIPKERSQAYQLVILSIIISIFVSLMTFLFIWVFETEINKLLSEKNMGKVVYFIPVSIFLVGTYQSLYYWFNREKNFKIMSSSKMIQSAGGVSLQVILQFFLKMGFAGLVFGQVMGQTIASITMARRFYCETKHTYKPSKAKKIILAKRYIRFPQFLIFAHLLNALSRNSPSIFFNIFFTTTVAGFFLLIQRVIGAPISLIGGAIGDVFRQQASEAYAKNGECIKEYLSAFKKLFLISFVPFVIFWMVAPDLFGFVFGHKWAVAGEYAQLLTPMFFLQFITSPLSVMFLIAEKQKHDLVWQTLLLFSTFVSLAIGAFYEDVYLTLLMFSISYTVLYSINGVLTWSFSKGDV